jgi:hypothetical protein
VQVGTVYDAVQGQHGRIAAGVPLAHHTLKVVDHLIVQHAASALFHLLFTLQVKREIQEIEAGFQDHRAMLAGPQRPVAEGQQGELPLLGFGNHVGKTRVQERFSLSLNVQELQRGLVPVEDIDKTLERHVADLFVVFGHLVMDAISAAQVAAGRDFHLQGHGVRRLERVRGEQSVPAQRVAQQGRLPIETSRV